MVSEILIHGFFRVHLWFLYSSFNLCFHVGFRIRISLGFLWVSPRVSLGFHLAEKQRSRESKKQRGRKVEKQEKQRRQKSREAENQRNKKA